MAPEQVVTLPDAAHARLADLNALQAQLVGDELRTLGGMGQAEVEDDLFDLGRDPVGVWPARAATLFDQGGDSAGLEGALDLVERVTVVAHDLARLGDVAEFLGQLQQRELALGTLG